LIPHYPHKPIASIESLCLALDIKVEELHSLALRSDSLFFLSKTEVKKDGGIRKTYDARKELKTVHHKISVNFLKKVIYPDYLHGSLKGKDYLSNTREHLNKRVIISEDASNFFPSISLKTVHEIWIGVFCFSHEVAEMLSTLVTHNGYLVQGCKASSYLANLALWKRESELEAALRLKGMTYTRYVDDITVSCERFISKKEQAEIISNVYALLKSINVKPNRAKHQVMSSAANQSVHRVNLNSGQPTLSKNERAKIKAAVNECETLYECIRGDSRYLALYKITMGRVLHMSRLHKPKADLLIERLKKVSPIA
jgi:hypothetical protein